MVGGGRRCFQMALSIEQLIAILTHFLQRSHALLTLVLSLSSLLLFAAGGVISSGSARTESLRVDGSPLTGATTGLSTTWGDTMLAMLLLIDLSEMAVS